MSFRYDINENIMKRTRIQFKIGQKKIKNHWAEHI